MKKTIVAKLDTLERRKANQAARSANVHKLVYSLPQACEAAGVNKDTLYAEINSGRLKSLKIGRRRLIRIESLKNWLASLEEVTS